MDKTVRTVYCECVNPMWEEYLKAGPLKYQPVVWIGGPAFENRGFDFFNRENAINQKIEFPREEGKETNFDDLLENEILIRMYDRFSLQPITDDTLITRLNRWNFEFWDYIFKKYKIEALVFPETPHVPYSYAGYLLARKIGIKIRYTATLPFRALTYILDSGENYNYFQGVYLLNDKTGLDQQEFYNKIRTEYGFKKGYAKVKPISFGSYLYNSIKNITKNFILGKKHRFAQIYKNKLAEISLAKYQFELFKRSLKKKKNKKFYQANVVKSVSENNKYKVVFALHFEPEQALLPLGGENYDQMQVINQLSSWLGDQGELYIKEHPWMFYYDRRGFVRGKSFYQELMKMNNVKLLDLDFDLSGNIDHFNFIATITGTIGWEVFLRKKPVLAFSKPWYFGLPLIYKFDGKKSPELIIKMVHDQNERIDYKGIYTTLSTVLKFSVSSVLNKSEEEYREHAKLLLNNLNNN